MGKLWCADIPDAHVAPQAVPKPVTLILPFYRNSQFLRRQIGWWNTYPVHLKDRLTAIIVDDGSPEPAARMLESIYLPFPIRLFRIAEDVRWNWLAARNIAAHHARQGWLMMTDMDHVLPASTAEALIYGQHDPGTIYGFSRIEHTGATVAPHPNSWFLTRSMFWAVGGYDETLSGHYGTDGDIRRRMAATAPMRILTDRLVRHEYQDDSSTTTYLRKQPEDAEVRRLIAARLRGWRPKVLSFPYAEVPLSVPA